MLMVHLIWVVWDTKKYEVEVRNTMYEVQKYEVPSPAKGRDFHSNYSLTFKKMCYEKSY